MDRVIKQAYIEPSDDVFHVPADEEPHARRPGGPEDGGETAEPGPDGEEAPQEPDTASRIAQQAAAAAQAAREELEELSRRILKTAGDEAAKIKQSAQEKAETLRENAKREGYRDAQAEKAQQIEQSLARVDRMLAELNERQERFFAEYERELESLAVNVAEKILAHAIERDPTQMAELVMQAVGSVKTDDWITVEISDQMPELIEHLQQDYSEYLNRRQIEFSLEDAQKGTCVIQTSTGITDASIATQLGNLRSLIRTQAREEP